MAELPELETLRRALEKESVGKRFKVPEVVGAKLTKRNGNKKVFQQRLEGAKVKSVDRRGPFLVGNLDNGELLLLHLGDKGYLEKVHFVDGSDVVKDQPLYTIDPREYEAMVAKAEADIERARADQANAEAQIALAQAELNRQNAVENPNGPAALLYRIRPSVPTT